jgi:hypothetical protein
MDNGMDFFIYVLKAISKPSYEGVKVIIETPLIAFKQRHGVWEEVVKDERVTVKTVFEYGEKDSSGRFFSVSDFEKAYNNFYSIFRYRPVIIYYKSDSTKKFESYMNNTATLLKTTLEIRDLTKGYDWIDNEYFYGNDFCRYDSSAAWFDSNPTRY